MTAMVITNAGLDLFRDGADGANSPKITYVALGTGTTAPAATDTLLQAEAFRKAVTSYTNGGSHGEVLVDCYLSPTDAVGVVIGEVGVFGRDANPTSNSGVLLGRVLYSHT